MMQSIYNPESKTQQSFNIEKDLDMNMFNKSFFEQHELNPRNDIINLNPNNDYMKPKSLIPLVSLNSYINSSTFSQFDSNINNPDLILNNSTESISDDINNYSNIGNETSKFLIMNLNLTTGSNDSYELGEDVDDEIYNYYSDTIDVAF